VIFYEDLQFRLCGPNSALPPLLPVIGVRAVLAVKMLSQQRLLHGCETGLADVPQGDGAVGELRHILEHGGVLDRFEGVAAPGEGAVGVDEHRRHARGVDRPEGLDDDKAGVFFIVAAYLGRGHRAGAGDAAVEIVGVGRAERRYAGARLRPDRRPRGMGVGDAADGFEGFVKLDVCRGVGRGVEVALDHLAAQVDEHHFVGRQLLIGHARGLDGEKPALAVDAADVAPCEDHKPVSGQEHVCLIYLLF
jgi:hypothetical protein